MVQFARELIGVSWLLLLLGLVGAQNYCSLCPNHIACNNRGDFGQACSRDRTIVPIDSSRVQLILRAHNEKRNRIALGQVPGYTSAAKMPVMYWDGELARLAELNAKTCTFAHDQCHVTKKHPWSGQNLAIYSHSASYQDPNTSFRQMIDSWFAEYKDANMGYIRAYPYRNPSKMIGHFTVMVNDKNNAVGCAMSHFQNNGWKSSYLVCNYGYTNILGQQVYESGPAASKCRGRHSFYNGLCQS